MSKNYFCRDAFHIKQTMKEWKPGVRKVKPFWVLLEQEMTGWQWHQLDYMQITCPSLQTDNHASTSTLNFVQAGCSSWRPTDSAKALKALETSNRKSCMHYQIVQLPMTFSDTTTTTTVLRSFFQDHPGEPVPEENFWTLWCKGRLTEADTPTIRLGATPSRLTFWWPWATLKVICLSQAVRRFSGTTA